MDIRIEKEITIKDLIKDYQNLGQDGVYAYNNDLEVRPPYQREYVYKGTGKDSAVIDSIVKGYPIGLMYWCIKEDGTYECLDGQQRIISICEFVKNSVLISVDGNPTDYASLVASKSEIINRFLNYKLLIAICTGTADEKLKWFERINTAGEPLTPQEMRNAIYSGPWVTAAKKYFSHLKCTAWHRTEKHFGKIMSSGLRIDRQEWLEQVIEWKAEFDGYDNSDKNEMIKQYMVKHRWENEADDLIDYFEEMVDWIKDNFKYKPLMEKCNWGYLYNKYHNINLKKVETDKIINDLIANAKNDGITHPKGIYEYVFDGDLRHLSDRAFPKEIKKAKWDIQNHKCAVCSEEFDFDDMVGDHILPWSKGGTTTIENCQMLCTTCNAIKTNKMTIEAKNNVDKLKVKVDN